MNIRGVSPLIATVLLIAFAVSLGAVIMNLGASIVEDPCADVSASIFEAGNQPRICYDMLRKEVVFTVANKGVGIVGLKASVIGDGVDEAEYYEEIDQGSNYVAVLPLKNVKSVDAFSLVAIVQAHGEFYYCADKSVQYAPINKC